MIGVRSILMKFKYDKILSKGKITDSEIIEALKQQNEFQKTIDRLNENISVLSEMESMHSRL